MKGLVALLVVLLISPRALDAATQDGFYVELNPGQSSMNDAQVLLGPTVTFEGGATIGGAVGYRFPHHFRAEVNLAFHEADVDRIDGDPGSGDVSITNYMANVFYDFDLGSSPMDLYLGTGLGGSSVDLNASSSMHNVDSIDGDVAFNLMVGASYRVHENIDLSLGYRYLFVFGGFGTDFELHEVVIGVRYNF